MIQSIVKPAQLQASFPMLMLCHQRHIIVLFSGVTTGTIVGILPTERKKEDELPDWCKVGYFTTVWETGTFEPWLGTVTLSNQ